MTFIPHPLSVQDKCFSSHATLHQATMMQWPDAGWMLGQRLRRWTNIDQTLVECCVSFVDGGPILVQHCINGSWSERGGEIISALFWNFRSDLARRWANFPDVVQTWIEKHPVDDKGQLKTTRLSLIQLLQLLRGVIFISELFVFYNYITWR